LTLNAETAHSPELRRPNELQLLPKLNKRALGSMVLISFSIRPLTLSRQPNQTSAVPATRNTRDFDVLFFDCQLFIGGEKRKDKGEERRRQVVQETPVEDAWVHVGQRERGV